MEKTKMLGALAGGSVMTLAVAKWKLEDKAHTTQGLTVRNDLTNP